MFLKIYSESADFKGHSGLFKFHKMMLTEAIATLNSYHLSGIC